MLQVEVHFSHHPNDGICAWCVVPAGTGDRITPNHDETMNDEDLIEASKAAGMPNCEDTQFHAIFNWCVENQAQITDVIDYASF
ncbi:hypothetical protein CKO28_03000 [Rhodovibrio sodomensis]|uniref:Uncharacterized protein n=1 Tax=Rhodovibrio sodomensis TaxID=1088 RepID=A0ABS1DAS9_9PROT|nr:hypothetical protein [Rhodovibrio sodomensis]MBK1667011.1 hypothetical protein [Rhodovibrio sodomensis]